jgi:hypothetical protein
VRRSSHLVAATAAAALLVPAAAHAAYAPKRDGKIDPATPSTPPAITSTVTQAGGETPSKTVRVSFPAGFTAPNPPVMVDICTAEQEQARSCPEGSQIGKASATASVVALPVQLTGTVHYGGVQNDKLHLIVFLDNAMLNQHVTVDGFVEVRPTDFGFDTVFDNLPNQLTTSFTLALDGAPRSLAVNPVKCGDYTFQGAFTSQQGEQATSSSTVTVSGCKTPPLGLSPPDLAPERPRAGRGATLRFQLSEDAAVIVTVKRQRGGKQVQRVTLAGHEGDNAVKRLGRRLKAGRYTVRVIATAPDGRVAGQKLTLVVRKRR